MLVFSVISTAAAHKLCDTLFVSEHTTECSHMLTIHVRNLAPIRVFRVESNCRRSQTNVSVVLIRSDVLADADIDYFQSLRTKKQTFRTENKAICRESKNRMRIRHSREKKALFISFIRFYYIWLVWMLPKESLRYSENARAI